MTHAVGPGERDVPLAVKDMETAHAADAAPQAAETAAPAQTAPVAAVSHEPSTAAAVPSVAVPTEGVTAPTPAAGETPLVPSGVPRKPTSRREMKEAAEDEARARFIRIDAVPGLVAALREAFNRGTTRPTEWRMAQLERLEKMFIENIDVWTRALVVDLNKSVALRRLNKNVKPTALLFPALLCALRCDMPCSELGRTPTCRKSASSLPRSKRPRPTSSRGPRLSLVGHDRTPSLPTQSPTFPALPPPPPRASLLHAIFARALPGNSLDSPRAGQGCHIEQGTHGTVRRRTDYQPLELPRRPCHCGRVHESHCCLAARWRGCLGQMGKAWLARSHLMISNAVVLFQFATKINLQA